MSSVARSVSRRLRRLSTSSGPTPHVKSPPEFEDYIFTWPPDELKRFRELVALQSILSKAPHDPVDHGPKLREWEARMNSGTRVLPGRVEREIADHLAFLAAADPGHDVVAAACVEERELREGGGLQFRVAVDGYEAVSTRVLGRLRNVCKALRRAARADHGEEHAREAVWQKILDLEAPKIHADLTAAFDRPHHPLDELFEATLGQIPASMGHSGRAMLEDIYELVQNVVDSSLETCGTAVADLLDVCFRARRSRPVKAFLKSGPSHRQLTQTVERLGRYKAACHSLVGAVLQYPLAFGSIDVELVEPLHEPLQRPLSYAPGELSLLRVTSELTGQPDQYLLQQLRTLTGLSEHRLFTKYADACTTPPHLHAELQLVQFYTAHPALKRPDFIGCSKKSCYLCTMFLKLHGHFGVSKSHQNLYPSWTLPSFRCSSAGEVRRFGVITEHMTRLIETTVKAALGRHERDRRPYADTSSHGGSTALLSTASTRGGRSPPRGPSPVLGAPTLAVPSARSKRSERSLRGSYEGKRVREKGSASMVGSVRSKKSRHSHRHKRSGSSEELGIEREDAGRRSHKHRRSGSLEKELGIAREDAGSVRSARKKRSKRSRGSQASLAEYDATSAPAVEEQERLAAGPGRPVVMRKSQPVPEPSPTPQLASVSRVNSGASQPASPPPIAPLSPRPRARPTTPNLQAAPVPRDVPVPEFAPPPQAAPLPLSSGPPPTALAPPPPQPRARPGTPMPQPTPLPPSPHVRPRPPTPEMALDPPPPIGAVELPAVRTPPAGFAPPAGLDLPTGLGIGMDLPTGLGIGMDLPSPGEEAASGGVPLTASPPSPPPSIRIPGPGSRNILLFPASPPDAAPSPPTRPPPPPPLQAGYPQAFAAPPPAPYSQTNPPPPLQAGYPQAFPAPPPAPYSQANPNRSTSAIVPSPPYPIDDDLISPISPLGSLKRKGTGDSVSNASLAGRLARTRPPTTTASEAGGIVQGVSAALAQQPWARERERLRSGESGSSGSLGARLTQHPAMTRSRTGSTASQVSALSRSDTLESKWREHGARKITEEPVQLPASAAEGMGRAAAEHYDSTTDGWTPTGTGTTPLASPPLPQEPEYTLYLDDGDAVHCGRLSDKRGVETKIGRGFRLQAGLRPRTVADDMAGFPERLVDGLRVREITRTEERTVLDVVFGDFAGAVLRVDVTWEPVVPVLAGAGLRTREPGAWRSPRPGVGRRGGAAGRGSSSGAGSGSGSSEDVWT